MLWKCFATSPHVLLEQNCKFQDDRCVRIPIRTRPEGCGGGLLLETQLTDGSTVFYGLEDLEKGGLISCSGLYKQLLLV